MAIWVLLSAQYPKVPTYSDVGGPHWTNVGPTKNATWGWTGFSRSVTPEAFDLSTVMSLNVQTFFFYSQKFLFYVRDFKWSMNLQGIFKNFRPTRWNEIASETRLYCQVSADWYFSYRLTDRFLHSSFSTDVNFNRWKIAGTVEDRGRARKMATDDGWNCLNILEKGGSMIPIQLLRCVQFCKFCKVSCLLVVQSAYPYGRAWLCSQKVKCRTPVAVLVSSA